MRCRLRDPGGRRRRLVRSCPPSGPAGAQALVHALARRRRRGRDRAAPPGPARGGSDHDRGRAPRPRGPGGRTAGDDDRSPTAYYDDEAPTTTTSPPLPPPTTCPRVTPPPTTTPPPTPAPAADPGHGELAHGTTFERDIRQVHIQLNEAIGFQRSNYDALAGAPELVESLLGQRPEYDPRLRDTLGHLRQAVGAHDRNAASAAHTIIYGIEKELGTAGQQ